MERERNSDRRLMERFRAGDRDAFATVYRTHYPAVLRFAFYITGDAGRASELTQEVFFWLIHHPCEFDPERGDLAAFLGGVARKRLRHQQRTEVRWRPIEESGQGSTVMHDCGGAAVQIAISIDTEVLRRAIAVLPERYRDAVILCDLESKSYEEAARLLDCAVGTIRSRLHRARQLLARKLAPHRESHS